MVETPSAAFSAAGGSTGGNRPQSRPCCKVGGLHCPWESILTRAPHSFRVRGLRAAMVLAFASAKARGVRLSDTPLTGKPRLAPWTASWITVPRD